MKKQGTVISVLIILALIALIIYMQRDNHPTKTPEVISTQIQTATTPTSTTNQSSTTTTMNPKETTTADGLKITVVKEGTGAGAVQGDTVSVNYTGSFPGGAAFDSNVDPKFSHVEPFSFVLGSGMVIKGWDEGVLGMKTGEKRHLVIPASLGYGAAGAGGVIPPNAVLEFDVEVVSISHK